MTNDPDSKNSDKPQSMVDADTANGESLDTDQVLEKRRDDDPVSHPTGIRQAEQNAENDPPA